MHDASNGSDTPVSSSTVPVGGQENQLVAGPVLRNSPPAPFPPPPPPAHTAHHKMATQFKKRKMLLLCRLSYCHIKSPALEAPPPLLRGPCRGYKAPSRFMHYVRALHGLLLWGMGQRSDGGPLSGLNSATRQSDSGVIKDPEVCF